MFVEVIIPWPRGKWKKGGKFHIIESKKTSTLSRLLIRSLSMIFFFAIYHQGCGSRSRSPGLDPTLEKKKTVSGSSFSPRNHLV